jgi:GNAT superfamily N-acetyltransferase
MSALPEWATDMADLHVHAAPSLLPRHGDDAQTVAAERGVGFGTVVLKSHEGSTVERAAIAGPGVYGGVVLNSPMGGANPDAVEVAARLGGRVVWLPTVSARNHKAGAAAPELSVHRGFELRAVDVVCADGRLAAGWHEVLDVVAEHDLLLASGHLSAAETVVVFAEARRRGVQRLLVNHPLMAFLHWTDEAARTLQALDAHLELGILPDLLGDAAHASLNLTRGYPASLLVFGGDLGHRDHPGPGEGVAPWLHDLEGSVGADRAAAIMTTQTRSLLL